MTEALKAAIDELGPVAHLVSPNKLHHLYLGSWQQAYPAARLWGPPSTLKRRRDLPFDGTLGDAAPAAWAAAIDQAWVRGSVLFDEIVFFHRSSRTVIFGDLTENLSRSFLRAHWTGWQRWIARLWGITEPWGLAPLELRLSFLRRRRARAALEKVVSWRPERVVMAHGTWQQRDATAYVRKAFAWLLER